MQLSVFYNHILVASEQTGLSVDEVLRRVRSFGISAVELGRDEIGSDKEKFKEQLSKAKIAVSSIYETFDFGHAPDAGPGLELIDTAYDFGASKVLVIPGFIETSASVEERNLALQRMAATLREICDYAEEKGITVTMEDFDDNRAPYASSDELVWFLSEVPKLGCTFDTGNFIFTGENELGAFGKLADRTVHVHCKDRSLDEQNGGIVKITLNGTRLYPSPAGSGIIQIQEIINRLQTLGYDGTLVIEHFDSVDELAYMEQSAKWLRSIISK
ncbi:sugar phosphate isomerase/epimerase family protein [Paenibacillus puldeungensis]|uniref:Sugar phosphate isomerase/epimerase family protein n=1 Tax=Paenibacillus puldeungensis TaxID=696536 RepID=A0ABW3S1M9_9BACL